MKGINFVTDECDERVAVMIDLKEYGALWEDFYDTLVAASRIPEASAPWQTVKKSLEEEGRL